MVNLVAFCAIVLPFLAVTGSASGLGDSGTVSREIDTNPGSDRKVAAAWWADWHSKLLPLDKVSWEKYTHMIYAFA